MADTGIKGIDLYFKNKNQWQYLATGRPEGFFNEYTLVQNMNNELIFNDDTKLTWFEKLKKVVNLYHDSRIKKIEIKSTERKTRRIGLVANSLPSINGGRLKSPASGGLNPSSLPTSAA